MVFQNKKLISVDASSTSMEKYQLLSEKYVKLISALYGQPRELRKSERKRFLWHNNDMLKKDDIDMIFIHEQLKDPSGKNTERRFALTVIFQIPADIYIMRRSWQKSS